jgi:hypothetical protein
VSARKRLRVRGFSWRRVRLLLWYVVLVLLMIVQLWLIMNIADVSLIHQREREHAFLRRMQV